MNYKRYFIPNSMVFITIVTYNRKDFLLDYIDLIKRSLKYTKTKISFKIDAIAILKDHIHFNPMKHYNIAPKDWKYSSFKKYVNNKFYDINWCNFDDKYKISESEENKCRLGFLPQHH